MGCYLCAYAKQRTPKRQDDLPDDGVSHDADELGTCWRCYVHACGLHGTRYGRFECAICKPALAARRALGIVDGDREGEAEAGASIELARLVGQDAGGSVREGAAQVLARIRADEERARESLAGERASLAWADADEEPNVLTDLAEVVRTHAGAEAHPYTLAAEDASQEPFAGSWLDAAARVARESVARRDPAAALEDADAVTVIAGALLMASSVAQDPQTEALAEVVLPPWRVPYPGLLDPLLLMMTTAFALAGATAA